MKGVQWLFLVAILISNILEAQSILFHHDFAPQEGLIKHVERPIRDEICLNGAWQFMPVKLEKGVSFEDIKNQKFPEFKWEEVPLKVPSPWNVNGFTNGEGGDFKSFPSYPESWNNTKSGWLKKTIKIPADWTNNRFILHFEAVAGYAKVFVNGIAVGEHFDSFLPFSFDITEHVTTVETLEVVVWVAHGSLLNDPGNYGRRNYVAGSFWGIFIAGIWQDVFLQKIPNIYIEDTFIKPLVSNNTLEVEVEIKNTTAQQVKFSIDAEVKRWVNLVGKSNLNTPLVNWKLGEKALDFESEKLHIGPYESKVFILKTKVDGSLDLWSPESPNLYGLVLKVNTKRKNIDIDYTRFGWREFKIDDTQFLLNNKPIQIKGDSWHFTGVPQMTRRYAYAWYKMLLDANANGLRLHAQVFPRFYLEMADEMGICVLDETAIWSSDGGPKIDSEIYWQACRQHVKNLVLRDRNYPSVMGWSVCNETLPVTKHVFNAPQKLIEKNIEEINNWVAIVQANDPTRTWISGDGETQEKTDLPTVIGHYGNFNALKHWSSQNKPWGIGETGMAYYGTPAQVAKVNGDRAYESQLGRMEGLAGEAFNLISKQRDYNASYSSVFNLAWYGLKPLALGLTDTSMAPTLNDGIIFHPYQEGKPGYQPERLGPYCTTFNPGYDPTLPLYKPWPLFEAVKAAYSDNYKSIDNKWAVKKDNRVKRATYKPKEGIVFLSGTANSKLKQNLENLGLEFESLNAAKNQLIIVDGQQPIGATKKLLFELRTATQKGSLIYVWSVSKQSKAFIEAVTNCNLELYNRRATSYIINQDHALLSGLNNASFYFSEIIKEPVSKISLGGKLLENSQVLLKACDTDWQKWNYQGEDIKTAKVYRNEKEFKHPGSVIVRKIIGDGELIVSTVDFFTLGNQSKHMVKDMLFNLGATFKEAKSNLLRAINEEGILQHVNFYGAVKNDSYEIEKVFKHSPLKETEFANVEIGTITNGKQWKLLSANKEGIFNFKNENLKPNVYTAAYMSFWVYSPRSLTDLLIEPDMPRLDLHFGVDDAIEFSINGKVVKTYLRTGPFTENEFYVEGVPLEKGWNHILIKVGQQTGEWKTKLKFSSNKPEFLKKIKSVIVR
ncbi:hypothetical protein KFZ70_12510 [Tamlana fucoidanivorans]|uniref:Glycoside hydrolase family 2 n=1 Tax=Allotamlana fucoidanivorans TaxID=2583814 RepID=A0A5C4SLJ6_9FLAO|nr:sugar-binding domain-containing protein [Tamlana fucoidanivorans]TNJ44907.1 glycoside hydrolase family 2 [Tamlana fucoidanivorans]